MKPATHKPSRIAAIAWFWIWPTVLLGSALYALSPGVSWKQIVTAIVLPVGFGYIVVSIGAGVLKLWRWNIPGVVSGVPWHIGFYYAAYFVPVFAVCFHVVGRRADFVSSALAGAVSVGIGMFIVGTLHDIAVRWSGAATVPSRHRAHWKAVLSYSPPFFGWAGAIYGAATFSADQYALSAVMLIALTAMCLPCLVWFSIVRRVSSRSYRRTASPTCHEITPQ